MKNFIITASIALGGISSATANLEIKNDGKYLISVNKYLISVNKSSTQALKFTEKSDPYLKTKMGANVAERVTKIIVDKLAVQVSEVTPEASFIKDLGADSIDFTELIMEFEKEFDISISDEDAQKLQTVGDVITYLEKHVQH